VKAERLLFGDGFFGIGLIGDDMELAKEFAGYFGHERGEPVTGRVTAQ
jgi:hypothetical protein